MPPPPKEKINRTKKTKLVHVRLIIERNNSLE